MAILGTYRTKLGFSSWAQSIFREPGRSLTGVGFVDLVASLPHNRLETYNNPLHSRSEGLKVITPDISPPNPLPLVLLRVPP